MYDISASFALGFLLGIMQVGSTMWRTIVTLEGNWLLSWVPSAIISLSYFAGMKFIVDNNIPGYIGFSVGAAIVVSYLAWVEKQKLIEKEDG
jgi:hypothetical protein